MQDSPLEQVERCYEGLLRHYHGAERAEQRAAAKLLLVALDRLRRADPEGWEGLVADYVRILSQDPERFEAMLLGNRGLTKNGFFA